MALRGVSLLTATTIVAEIGDLKCFASAPQLMAYLGVGPSEHSSGGSKSRGGITKTGNGHVRRVMCEREAPRQLDGRVEIDDAYLGGELPGGKSGRGSENKVAFIAAVQTTEAGHPLRVCLKKLKCTKEAIVEWSKTALAASTRVVSDGLWWFTKVVP